MIFSYVVKFYIMLFYFQHDIFKHINEQYSYSLGV